MGFILTFCKDFAGFSMSHLWVVTKVVAKYEGDRHVSATRKVIGAYTSEALAYRAAKKSLMKNSGHCHRRFLQYVDDLSDLVYLSIGEDKVKITPREQRLINARNEPNQDEVYREVMEAMTYDELYEVIAFDQNEGDDLFVLHIDITPVVVAGHHTKSAVKGTK